MTLSVDLIMIEYFVYAFSIMRYFIVFWFRSLNHTCLVTRTTPSKFFNKEITETPVEFHSYLYERYIVRAGSGEHLCVMIQ